MTLVTCAFSPPATHAMANGYWREWHFRIRGGKARVKHTTQAPCINCRIHGIAGRRGNGGHGRRAHRRADRERRRAGPGATERPYDAIGQERRRIEGGDCYRRRRTPVADTRNRGEAPGSEYPGQHLGGEHWPIA